MTTLEKAPTFVAPVAPAAISAPELDVTDERLMELLKERDPNALETLHDRYAGLLKALIMRILHNEAEAEDLLQEVFVEIWNRVPNYNPEKGKPLGWMVTLSRRRAIDRLRKCEAYCRAEERLTEETKNHSDELIMHVEEDIALSEMRHHVTRILACLPPAQKEAIELAYYKGMSQREIAAHTGIPLGTIKTRLELGMKKLTLAMRGMEDLL